jgi:hypothetical protein
MNAARMAFQEWILFLLTRVAYRIQRQRDLDELAR